MKTLEELIHGLEIVGTSGKLDAPGVRCVL